MVAIETPLLSSSSSVNFTAKMPTKMTKSNHLKSHTRSASASTHNLGKHAIVPAGGATGLPHLIDNADITRTRSGEKIRRTGSDLQTLQRLKNAPPYTAYQQHPVHQPQPDRGTGYQPKRRGITVLEVEANNDGDDDEWVSSESGAATPADNEEEDGPQTPREMINTQQLFPQNTTIHSTGINSTSRITSNLDTEQHTHNSSNVLNTKPSHMADTDHDSDMITTRVQAIRSALPHPQFQSQAQLHPMTRTHTLSTTGTKRGTASAMPPPALVMRKHVPAPITRSDALGFTTEKFEPIQPHMDGVHNANDPAATAEIPHLNHNNQVSRPEPQVPSPEIEQAATPRVGPNLLRPTTSSETSQSKTHTNTSRPHVRQRPQSMADIRLIDIDAKPRNEHANDEDVLVQSPATELPPSRTRPPSMRSMRSLYRHPLIRTRTYTPSTPPLTATAPPAFSPATASPTLTPNAAMTWTNHVSPHPAAETSHSGYFWPYKLKRQSSQSSVSSVATLPLTSTVTAPSTGSFNINATRERPRTLSHTSAALSSLAAAAAHQMYTHHYFGVPGFTQVAPSRPASPPLPVMFPPPPNTVHAMLPAPLTDTHLSATAFQRVMADSFARVRKTKVAAEDAGGKANPRHHST